MKAGYVANSQGNLSLLERALVTLIERHRVDHVVPLDSAAYDVEAVLRSRRARFPAEVPWSDPGFADFVLASVLQGVVSVPDEEVERNGLLSGAVRDPEEPLEFGKWRVHVLPLGHTIEQTTADLVVTAGGDRGVDTTANPPTVRPGHLRADQWEGAPATCAIVEDVGSDLRVTFVTPAGDTVGQPFRVT